MSDESTKRMIRLYQDGALPTLFFSGFFQSPPENFYNSETIELDVLRSGREIAVAVQDMNTGYKFNAADVYTNKEFKAPFYSEAATLNAFDLMKRMAGDDPFKDVNFQANATRKSFTVFRKLEQKILRALEFQASNILQTGILTLTDEAANTIFTIDFKPKGTHFPAAAVSWGTPATAVPFDDLLGLAQVIDNDGLGAPTTVIMGETAQFNFMNTDQVKEQLDNRRIMLGELKPETRGQGATFVGRIWVGSYLLDLWTYKGKFDDPVTGLPTRYLDPNKVVMLTDGARLDATFGGIPRIAPPESRVMPFLPGRISNGANGSDIIPNAWLTQDGNNLTVAAQSRPLMIPTAIDTFGCIDAT